MFRRFDTRRDAGRPAPRSPGPYAALALPAAVPVLLAAAVSSVSVSPTDVAAGAFATGTVTLDAPAAAATRVSLSSSNAAVATVPASIPIPAAAASANFTVRTAAGAVGCATISARIGETLPKSTAVFVPPPVSPEAPLRLQLGANPVAGGLSLRGRVTLAQPTGGGAVVQLSSSSPLASVPTSVTVLAGTASATFPITTQNPGTLTCAVITATSGSLTARALLKITSGSGP